MLGTRAVTDLRSLCPAAYTIGETPAGSGILCRISGNLVATGTDPSSLRAFCCCPVPAARDITADGDEVLLGYQNCPVWEYRRKLEIGEKHEFAEGTPQRVKDGYAKSEFLKPA